jgi:hypothetical protein
VRPREDFVGTIVHDKYILVEFAGEGAMAVVYTVATLDAPTTRESVLKFIKPEPFLEMDVLHCSLRVDIERYPNHPMLLGREERLARLRDEMIERISSPGWEFRVSLYRELMDAAVQGTLSTYNKRDREGTIPTDFLSSDEGLRRRVDENFLLRIKELLEEDNIVEPYVPLAERLLDVMERAIVEWSQAGTYGPFSQNPLYKVLGLQIEGFINAEELDHIAADPRVACHVSADNVEGLWVFATILYGWAAAKLEAARSKPPRDAPDTPDLVEWEESRHSGRVDACVQACRLIEAFADSARDESGRMRGLANYWRGRALNLLPGHEQEVLEALYAALPALRSANRLVETHDALIDLVALTAPRSREEAAKYTEEALAIRRQLGVPPPEEEMPSDNA